MLFFLNRYELPALHAGLVTPSSPRMAGSDRGRGEEVNGSEVVIPSPPRIRPSSMTTPDIHQEDPPPIPQVNSDDRSAFTGPTAPLSSTHFTPESDQQSLLPPAYPGLMRSYAVAASTSLQSIRSLGSIQSSTSLAAERIASPNFIFQGGYSFDDSGMGDGEEDSYIARVTSH